MIGNELRPLGNPSFPNPLAGNSRIAEPYSDLSKLFRRRCRIIRAAVPRARIRHNPGVLHCIITYPLHYCVSGESEPDRAPDPGQTRPGRIGRADGRRLNLGLGGMKIQFDVQSPNFRHVYVSKLPPIRKYRMDARIANIRARFRVRARTSVYGEPSSPLRLYIYIRGGIRLHGHSALASMTLNVIISADNK